ncbi:MAG: hypothetical protein CL928_06150 [Deltaproteobacteria bacterium]|nr:hypothetical protein [Deltaproteobacteria bacterium]
MASFARGTAAIFVAKMVFLVAGYALYLSLSRLLTTEQFGIYGVLFAVVSLINMVLINGTLQTVSHFVAGRPGSESAVRRRGFFYQAVFCIPALSLYVVAAPLLGEFFRDETLVPLLRGAAVITLIYAFYAINVGYLNGRRWFVKQAILDVSFSILKVSAIVALVYMGYGVPGVIVGFAAAAFAVLLLSFVLVGRGEGGEAIDLSVRQFTGFAAKVLAVALFLNFVLNADIFLLKRLAAPDEANLLTGFYTAAQSIARIPYFIMVTASLVMFPTIAKLHGDDPKVREQRAETSSRATAMVLGLVAGMCAVTVPVADRIVLFLYPAEYLPAAAALVWLIPALGTLTLLNLTVSMISGAGRPGVSTFMLLGTLAIQVMVASALIPTQGIVGAAIATTAAGTVVFVGALLWLVRNFGSRFSLGFWFIVVLATGLGAVISSSLGQVLPEGRVWTLLLLSIAFVSHVAVLLLAGVLTGAGVGPGKRRVLLVSKPLEPPFNDGSKTFVRALVSHLDPSDIAVCVANPARAREALPEGVEICRAWRSAGSFGGRLVENLWMFIWLFLHRYEYRAIHFFFAPNRRASTMVRWLKRLSPGVGFVQTVLSRPRDYEEVGSLLFGDVVTVGSEHALAQVKERAPSRDLRLVRPAIADDLLLPDRAEALGRLGEDPECFHLLFAGDIDHGGALPHLAQIATQVLDGSPKVRFHFSVRLKGVDTRDRAQEFYDEHLSAYGERASIRFDYDPFVDLLAAADALVIPCENLYTKVDAPLVALEAMAAGKPVFFLDLAPMNEITPVQLRSMLLGRDGAELAERILTFANSDADRMAAAESLREHVAARFSAELAAGEMGRIYDTV